MDAMHSIHDHWSASARGSETAQAILLVPMCMNNMRVPILDKPIQLLHDLHRSQYALIQYLGRDAVGQEAVMHGPTVEQDGVNIEKGVVLEFAQKAGNLYFCSGPHVP